jgi:oligopeptide/dipeptide ABC transporter ATP-binding protein
VKAVDGVSVHIDRGETLGLVGESGCGKTTLARTVTRLDPAESGTVVFEGTDLLAGREQDIRPLRRKLQIIFQDPFSSLNPRMSVLDIVTEGLVQHGVIRSSERIEKAETLLRDVGMGAEALHRYPHEFSGGQRQRISNARAISLRPSLVICDEAVSALDVSVQAQVINLLMDLRDKYELSYLFISHDLSVVRHISDRIAVMYLGVIVEQGPSDDVIDNPRHPYTRALISAIPRVREEKRERIVLAGDVPSPSHPPSGCRFHPRCPFAKPDCSRVVPQLEAPQGEDDQRLVACLRANEI